MQMSDQRFHNQMSQVEFHDWLQTKKTTFEKLQNIVRVINRSTVNIFDSVVQQNIDQHYFKQNQTEWEYDYDRMAKALRKLHLLNIPTHYRKDGSLYIVREEVQDIGLIYSSSQEAALEKVNKFRDKWQSIKRMSKAKDDAKEEYESELKYFQDNYSQIQLELKYIGLAGDGLGYCFADIDWLDQF